MMAAVIASLCGTVGHAMMLANLTFTVIRFTRRHASRKALFLDVFEAGIVIGELGVEVFNRISEFFGDGLSAIHA